MIKHNTLVKSLFFFIYKSPNTVETTFIIYIRAAETRSVVGLLSVQWVVRPLQFLRQLPVS